MRLSCRKSSWNQLTLKWSVIVLTEPLACSSQDQESFVIRWLTRVKKTPEKQESKIRVKIRPKTRKFCCVFFFKLDKTTNCSFFQSTLWRLIMKRGPKTQPKMWIPEYWCCGTAAWYQSRGTLTVRGQNTVPPSPVFHCLRSCSLGV